MNSARHALAVVVVGIALMGYAPSPTTTTTPAPVDNELQAEQEYSSGFEYYNKVKSDEVYSAYAEKEINWCNNLIKALHEDA